MNLADEPDGDELNIIAELNKTIDKLREVTHDLNMLCNRLIYLDHYIVKGKAQQEERDKKPTTSTGESG